MTPYHQTLAVAAKIVIKNGLTIPGVSVPEKM